MAGSLEPNFNNLEVFIDSAIGSAHSIGGAALPQGFDGFFAAAFRRPTGITPTTSAC